MYKLSKAPAGERRLLNTEQAAAYLSIGKNAIAEIGADAQATVRVGSRVLYDKEKLDAWIDRQVAATNSIQVYHEDVRNEEC